MRQEKLEVPEVHCGHCVSSIEGAVAPLAGVEAVKVNLDNKDVTVDFDETAIDLASIVAVIQEQGYDVGGGPKVIELGRPQ